MTDLRLVGTRTDLQAELLVWLMHWNGEPEPDDARFGELALRLFAYQVQAIPAYGAFVRTQLGDPANVQDWRQIPLVPVTAFKFAQLHTADAADRPALSMETSGTSDGQPGRVCLLDTALYDASLHAAFRHFVLPDVRRDQRFRCLSLVPKREDRPQSSLGYMVRRLASRWDDGKGTEHLLPADAPDGLPGLNVERLAQALHRAVRDGVPALIFATTLALEAVIRQWPQGQTLELPAGSRLMDTGGPKGRVLTADREAQHAFVQAHWGLPASHVVGELGMTELCSQRYEPHLQTSLLHGTAGQLRGYAAPPWLRSVVVDPATRAPLGPNQTGMVGHIDLANLDTCAFVMTADLGALDSAGCLQLAGRIPGSEWRGCGLDAEQVLGLRHS